MGQLSLINSKGDGEGNIDPTAANLQLSQVNPHTHTNRKEYGIFLWILCMY